MRNKPKVEKQMRRHLRSKRWMNTEFLLKSFATDSEQISKQVFIYLNKGLSTEQAIKRNAEEGDNKLPEKKKEPAWLRFLKEITNWFAIMLWIGSILCIIIYIIQPTGNLPNLYLAFVLMIVVLLTGAITFAQGAKSEALM